MINTEKSIFHYTTSFLLLIYLLFEYDISFGIKN